MTHDTKLELDGRVPLLRITRDFDATPEQRKQAMRNQSLRDKMMRGHAETIAAETRRMMDGLGDEGEIDLLDFFSELTIYTSSACLIGRQFREELSSEYYRVFYELEQGTDAIAYVNSATLPRNRVSFGTVVTRRSTRIRR